MVGLECINIVLFDGKWRLRRSNRLDTLAESILRDLRNDLARVLLLSVDPARHLVKVLRRHLAEELVDLWPK